MTDNETAAPAIVTSTGSTRLLLTFCGSVDDACEWTTIGDLMAVYNVARRLRDIGVDFQVCWNRHLFDLSGHCIDNRKVWNTSFTTNIFVCGPLWENARAAIDMGRASRRIAVGVSIVADHPPEGLVDAWHVRDSADTTGFDLAFADIGYPHIRVPPAARRDQLALCFVGPQREYSGRADNKSALEKIREGSAGYRRVRVETLLDPKRLNPEGVEADLQVSRGLITTRLHGSLTSIFHDVPCVAIDQVEGGAKVTRLLGSVGYPVISGAEATPQTIAAAVEHLWTAETGRALAAAREKVIARSRAALDDAIELILREAI